MYHNKMIRKPYFGILNTALEIPLFIKGFMIGLVVAAPLGPIGIICLQRTLSKGYLAGLFSGLGISTADAIYGALAVFGVTAISSFLISQELWLRVIGGIVICGLGIRIYRQAGYQKIAAPSNNKSCFGAYFSALVFTLMNPALIISFTAIFASWGIVYTRSNYFSALLLIVGVFSGSAIWWVFLSGLASRLKTQFTNTLIQKINHISGELIAGFGLLMVGSAVFLK
jgi:threonine/homoserine/homoserine lactone efflux protein